MAVLDQAKCSRCHLLGVVVLHHMEAVGAANRTETALVATGVARAVVPLCSQNQASGDIRAVKTQVLVEISIILPTIRLK